MGIHVIKMPDIGEGIAEVELVAWNVNPGDSVIEDQPLADVMTDKATVEIPSPVAGKVLSLGGKPGQVMAVGAELIRIEVAGVGNAGDATPVAGISAAPLPPSQGEGRGGDGAATAGIKVEKRQSPPPPPASLPRSHRDGPGPLPSGRSLQSQGGGEVPHVIHPLGEKPIASPAVRRRAWDLGIELRYVSGSGTAGRITHEDLDAYAAGAGGPVTPLSGTSAYAQRDDEVAVPVIGLRRKIAQKMQESKRRIPHFTYVEEIDVTELDALRTRLNETRGAQRGRLSVLPFLMRAMVLALRDFPQINARYDDEAAVLTRYGAVHIGIATQTEGGLMVPVVRHAEARDLWSSAAEIVRLAEAARNGSATREELTGSTITISSLGVLGGVVSTPVINHPEVAIVGVNRMVLRPMIRGGAVVARQMMNLSSSFDHRVVDGLHAAEFIQAVRGLLECPATLFVE
ncbi:MAG: dihydrolipoamide acetyltransferase family protein [Sterolibacterium sp.]